MNNNKDSYYTLYFSFFVFALLFMFRINTMWPLYDGFAGLFKYISLLLSLLVGVLCVKRYESSHLLLVIGIGLIVFAVGMNSENIYQMYLTYLIIIGAKDIPFRDIIKAHFVLALCFCLFNMTISELGWVRKNATIFIDERDGLLGDAVMRKDFGYGWSTDYANHVFFILLDYWLLIKGKLRVFEYFLFTLIIFFIIINCDARLAAGSILLILLLAFYLRMNEKKNKELNKTISHIFVYSIPFWGVVSFFATINYDDSNLSWVASDLILSGRLRLGYDAIQDVGIPWLGQIFMMYGGGNAGMGDTEYNFLDCAYIQSLVIWGWVLTLIWIYAYVVIARKANRNHNYTLLAAIFILSMFGVISPYLFNLKYCVLLLAITAIDENGNSNIIEETVLEE